MPLEDLRAIVEPAAKGLRYGQSRPTPAEPRIEVSRMSFPRILAATFLAAPFLASVLLLSGCRQPNNLPPPLPLPQPPGKDSFANTVAILLSGSQQLLALRQMGLSSNEIALYDKTTPGDGKLEEADLKEAFDLKSFASEERTRFFTKGPDTNQTLSSDKLPQADQNGDKRITVDEWLLYGHRLWLRQLKIPEVIYQNKIVMLWVRPDMTKTLDMLAPRLFSIADGNKDGSVTGDEVAAVTGVASGKTFEASQQGVATLVDPVIFSRLLQRSQGTFVRKVNEMFLRLDKIQVDGLVSKNELAQGAKDPENEGVPGRIQLQKETAGRLELERAILLAAQNIPDVQKAVIKWTWPETLPEP